MKAKAGFLMLLIGMMCFTGFGNTTADLDQDSTNSSLVDICDVELSVVTLTAFIVVKNQAAPSEAGSGVFISEAVTGQKDLTLLNFATADRNLELESIRYLTDVGWQSRKNYEKENHTLKDTNLHFSERKPRDGIMYDSFHFS